MSATGFLQLSGVVVDIVHRVQHLPAPGEEVETAALEISPGGGFNALIAAKRFGADVAYGGTLGTGPFADRVLERLKAEAIPVLVARRSARDQGTCSVIVDQRGERSFISHHGAERDIRPEDLEALSAASFGWLLLTGYALFKDESARSLLPWLKRLPRGPRILFDPGPLVAHISAPAMAAAMLRADWVSANAAEAEVMTGRADPSEAAYCLGRGRAGAIVRQGAEGCWLAHEDKIERIEGHAVEAVDTTGAGDAFDGVFAAACSAGHPPRTAAILANAAAAISVTRSGPAQSPAFEEIQAFLEHAKTLHATGA